MPLPIIVTPNVRVPENAQVVKSVRSSGPGGQNVNKVASKIDLEVDVAAIEGLDDASRARLVNLAGRRVVRGRLRVISQTSRDRHRNLEAAREKVRDLVLRALMPPKLRRATRPDAAAKAVRLFEKKRMATVKALRKPEVDEE